MFFGITKGKGEFGVKLQVETPVFQPKFLRLGSTLWMVGK